MLIRRARAKIDPPSMSAVNDEDLRYTFSCPSCAGSFSISLAKIPPVQARFSCPKCSQRDGLSRRATRRGSTSDLQAEEPDRRPARPRRRPSPHPRRTAAASAPAVLQRSGTARQAAHAASGHLRPDGRDGHAVRQDLSRREERLRERRLRPPRDADADPHGGRQRGRHGRRRHETRRARGLLPELKSLFELRKTARFAPRPSAARIRTASPTTQCSDTGRPLCEECAQEKKFGGASVRVCAHCGGTAGDLHEAPGDIK